MSNIRNIIMTSVFLTLPTAVGMQQTVTQERGIESKATSSIDYRAKLRHMESNIAGIKTETQERLRAAIECGRDFTRVLLVGTTGSGKSTLLHALLGIPLKAILTPHGMLLDPEKELGTVAVGHKSKSETTVPNILNDPINKITYCDCPGFFDTIPEQRVLNAFAIDQLFTEPCKIKVLVVVAESEMDAGKGQRANLVLGALNGLLPIKSELKRSVGIIVTKTNPPERQAVGWLKYLSEGCGRENKLVRHFLNNVEKCVFDFPEPQSKGPYMLFKDRDRMISFFNDTPVVNPEHLIMILDEEALGTLQQLSQGFNDDAKMQLLSFTDEVGKKYRQECDLGKLQGWIHGLDVLMEATSDLGKFIEEARKLPQFSGSSFELILKKLNEAIPWQTFISNFLKEGVPEELASPFRLDIRRFLQPVLIGQKEELEGLKVRQHKTKEEVEESRRRAESLIAIEREEAQKKFDEAKDSFGKWSKAREILKGAGEFIGGLLGGAVAVGGTLLVGMAGASASSSSSSARLADSIRRHRLSKYQQDDSDDSDN